PERLWRGRRHEPGPDLWGGPVQLYLGRLRRPRLLRYSDRLGRAVAHRPTRIPARARRRVHPGDVLHRPRPEHFLLARGTLGDARSVHGRDRLARACWPRLRSGRRIWRDWRRPDRRNAKPARDAAGGVLRLPKSPSYAAVRAVPGHLRGLIVSR